jgi:hypothetical protein
VSRLDDLSPDQRAVLQLLLRQGKSYDELAALLRIDPAAVRSRASAALGALGPAIDDADRDELSDWMLGQQDELQVEDTLDLIDESPAALEWAIEVSDRLREGGLEPRAELPDDIEDETVDGEVEEQPAPTPAPTPAATPGEVPVAVARPAGEPPATPGFGDVESSGPRPSRLGGLLLLAGAAAVVVVLIVVLLTRGGDDSDSAASTSTPAAQTATTPTTATQQQITVEAQVNMRPTAKGGKALGVAQFFTDGTDHGVTVTAQNLQPNTSRDVYALWLAGGTKDKASSLLGFSPSKVKKNGRFSGSITLPDDAGDYREIVLTRETQASPTKPGTVILRGSLG